jgi:hypothetical protein
MTSGEVMTAGWTEGIDGGAVIREVGREEERKREGKA